MNETVSSTADREQQTLTRLEQHLATEVGR